MHRTSQGVSVDAKTGHTASRSDEKKECRERQKRPRCEPVRPPVGRHIVHPDLPDVILTELLYRTATATNGQDHRQPCRCQSHDAHIQEVRVG